MSHGVPDLEGGRARRVALILPVLTLWALLAIQLVSALALDDGRLMYSLDDAYIHLALAENLLQGHFGLNPGEASAPSSSILWPFLLAPFTPWSRAEWVPLLINVLCATATLRLFQGALVQALRPGHDRRLWTAVMILGVLAIPATNLVGLVFTGMEHSLQVLLAVTLVQGVIATLREGRPSRWLWVAIVLGPLIRYENGALSAAALVWLFWSGWRRGSILAALALGAGVLSYTGVLLSLGLGALPTSVQAKSAAVAPGGGLRPILYRLYENVSSTPGVLMSLAAVALCWAALQGVRSLAERRFAVCFAGALAIHVVLGRFGWYNRYEIYAWSAGLLVVLWLWRAPLRAALAAQSPWRTAIFAAVIVCITCREYVIALSNNAFATNNCYQQQYQLHRFATEFLREPVAVNDLGWVAWRNDEYVLDLWGLASLQALEARRTHTDSRWIAPLAAEHGVRLAMIYDKWFPELPEEWVRLGELRMGGIRVTTADDKVAFWALDPAAAPELEALVRAFAETLPSGASFAFEE